MALLWSQIPLQQMPPLMTPANVTAHLNELIYMGLMAPGSSTQSVIFLFYSEWDEWLSNKRVMSSFFQSLPISATQCLCLLLLTCLLALGASFPDVDIRNLYLLNGTMDDIMNAPPQSSQLGKYGPATGRGKQGPD